MSNLGECPKCGKRVLHVNVDKIVGLIDGESRGRGLSFSCIHCNAVLGVQIDPRAKPRVRRKTREPDAPEAT
jgi:hypothetical protein